MGSTDTPPQRLPLDQRILAELVRQPGQKAVELAETLAADRRDVNRCLFGELSLRVRQDQFYRWYPGAHRTESAPIRKSRAADTELASLARYYLECIAQDSDGGVRTFAASRYGDPDYAELHTLPIVSNDPEWYQAPGVARILGKVRAERGKLASFLGYPVRLRHHRTPKWKGFFVEPVMVWHVDLAGDQPVLADDLPTVNFAFLKNVTVGDSAQLLGEAAQLAGDLGLNSAPGELPENDELLDRLQHIRPDWDWRERLMPDACSSTPPLAGINEQGIYNRAIVCFGERSPYTQGLEIELKELAEQPDSSLAGTALGAWLSGEFPAAEPLTLEPLLEVVPLNTEQREAVTSALVNPLTVITGPPGTGKSQIITNLLVNAAWRNQRVLFASKNNKAVDVVETRINELVDGRSALLRLGSRDYQAKVLRYLTSMLSGAATVDDKRGYDEALARHRQLMAKAQELDRAQKALLEARNEVYRLADEVEPYRDVFGAERFGNLCDEGISAIDPAFSAYREAIDRADRRCGGGLRRLLVSLTYASRLERLAEARGSLAGPAESLGVSLPPLDPPNLGACRVAVAELDKRVRAARRVVQYHTALEVLRAAQPLEEIARQHLVLAASVSENSEALWRYYLRLLPAQLSRDQRRQISDYAAVLELQTASERQGGASAHVRNRARALQQQVTQLFSCWAVTSLSARGRLPFAPAVFDLVVIDEASQCDIASALPLLFRAKRAAIIGDPQQLRHISALPAPRDAELQEKHGIFERRAAWMYSTRSLFDLAAALASAEDIVNLRDHFRSHADIIEFSNKHFYSGKSLRVATRYDGLRRPNKHQPGVIWQDVPGAAERPAAGGAINRIEATAVAAFLRDLLLVRNYQGSTGVVTPFRAQVQYLQEIIAADAGLTAAGFRSELLVSTVHQFQGDERDLMIFSPVVAAGVSDGALGFLRSNGNLFNVAITRARGQLQVIGDLSFARRSGIRYLEQFAAYVTELSAAGRHDQRANAEVNAVSGPAFPVVPDPDRVSEWERVLYRTLYTAGLRTIPQYKVEHYALDLALLIGSRKLDIEVDGSQHRLWTGEQCLNDRLRDMRLIELGWEVKRFANQEIRDNLNDCAAWIAAWADKAKL